MKNKLLLTGIIVGTMALSGCDHEVWVNQNLEVKTDNIDNNIIGNIPVKWQEDWYNAQLIGKDEGNIHFVFNGRVPFNYQYGEYLFKSPNGNEAIVIGKEDAMFVGERYDITFYRFKDSEAITTPQIFEAFFKEEMASGNFLIEHISNKVDGIMTYSKKLTRETE